MAPQEARRRGAAPVAEEPRRAAEVAAVPPAPLVGPSPPREAPAALPTQLAPMDVLLPSRQAPAASESDRREAREAEELRRERAEAEARRREAERAAPPDKKESGAVVQALMLLRRRYKDSDPAGLLACLQTLKAIRALTRPCIPEPWRRESSADPRNPRGPPKVVVHLFCP
ncbi:unnamed protein product [Prorocentrum cordatum]|uniref:RING-type E3 ubiquitin transferase n=1 Tax=Prorocentrum cordatum TaxID=2364126 RepID=A0ABN9UBI6_9DINO|nr:unnamed protein product [Polarella glacialis]